MIVRNESRVIRRCLESVKPLIDAWVIVDTGSEDGTQEIIRETMKGIPGELHERPWVDFSHNRTEALELTQGKGEFALLIDADESIVYEEGFVMPDLSEAFYMIEVHLGLLSAYRELLINTSLGWYWEGVLHEQVRCKRELTSYGLIENAYNLSTMESSRNLDPQKFAKDAEVLEKGLLAEPNNSRYVFYLGHTYAAMGELEKALKYYERRTQMGEWHQELYHSLYRIGFLQEILRRPVEIVIASYQKAYQFMPMRAEPLFRIAYHYYIAGLFSEAKRIAKVGMTHPIPEARYRFYLEEELYLSWLPKLYADCCFDLGENEEALAAYKKIEKASGLTAEGREEIRDNISLLNGSNKTKKTNNLPRRIKF